MLSWVEHEKCFITSGPEELTHWSCNPGSLFSSVADFLFPSSGLVLFMWQCSDRRDATFIVISFISSLGCNDWNVVEKAIQSQIHLYLPLTGWMDDLAVWYSCQQYICYIRTMGGWLWRALWFEEPVRYEQNLQQDSKPASPWTKVGYATTLPGSCTMSLVGTAWETIFAL